MSRKIEYERITTTVRLGRETHRLMVADAKAQGQTLTTWLTRAIIAAIGEASLRPGRVAAITEALGSTETAK